MNSSFLLVEHLSNVNAIIKQPLQMTQRIKFTCFDISKTFIVFGATSGGLYVYNRDPHQFIKLIPSKEGSVMQVCISPDEKHIALSTSKGTVVIIQNFFAETNIHYETYSEHRDNLVTAMQWYLDELFCGDNNGKVTVVVLPSLLAKAIFQVTCATLMHLESAVVQIDVYLKFLLISTLTRTYICDTEKEQYRQIGKKLRNGRFGACFAVNNIDQNVVPVETLTNKGVYKKLRDYEPFFTHINDNVQIFCSRPGTRMWEAKLNGSVTCTHQFKNFLKDQPTDIIKLDDNGDARFNICKNSDLKTDDLINFSKVFTFENKYIITFSKGGFYIFDPKDIAIVCWCNYYKNIKDLRIINNVIYIWDDDLEIHVIGFYSLEKFILNTLFNKQYYMCADLCIHYIAGVLNLIKTSKNIHLICVLKEKLLERSVVEKMSPIFEAIANFTEKMNTKQKLGSGIVVVNPFINTTENQYETEQLPETFQKLRDISTNVTEKFTESTKNLKEKFQILETTVKNLTLIDNVAVSCAATDNITSSDCNYHEEISTADITESPLKIFSQQYQLFQINYNLETPKFYELLYQYDVNKVVELFNTFSSSESTTEKSQVQLWCYQYYLKYLRKINFQSLVLLLQPEDIAINYAIKAFLAVNTSNDICVCSYPLPLEKGKPPQYYDIGCVLLKKFWCNNRQLLDEVVNKVPFMWKYVLNDLRINDCIAGVLPLLIQFGDEDLIRRFSIRFKYDDWDDAIKLLIKLRKHTCVNCDNNFDTKYNIMNWKSFGTIMIEGVGPQSAIKLLTRYSSIIPSNDLDTDFYQLCIFTAVVDNSHNGTRSKVIHFAKSMQNNKETTVEFDKIMKAILERKRPAKHKTSFENVCSYEISQNEAAKPYSKVPGPKPVPILGNTWRLLPIIGQYDVCDVAKISHLLYTDYGNIVKLSGLIGRPDLLFVYDADEIEKVYRNEGPTPFRPSMPCLVKYKSVVRKDFFGDLPGVVGVHGEPWKEFRSKVQKPILQLQTVKKYIEPVEEVTNFFIERILQLKDENEEMPPDFDNEVHKWALECIGRVALDTRLGCLDPDLTVNSEPQKIIDAAKYALRNVAILELKFPFWRYFPTTIWHNYIKNMNYFVEICTKYIDEAMIRLKNKNNQDENDLSLIERILAKEADQKTAVILALDLILVGIDTISMAVCSILYQLATRPEQQEKVYQELKRIIPDPNTPLDVKLLDEMVFLKAFVKEVFRVYSTVIGNGRTLQKDTVIMGYNIPKGVQVVFPTLVTGVMKEYVSSPDQFIPERWINRNGDYKIHPYASLPYGHGARMCLGRRFADLEIQVLLAKLIRSYKLDYFHQPLEYKITFMYAPEGELKFKVTKRDI
ncbi:hypothetical protein FQR65_LT04418 [Abscondita terminalis]|nr:hypothetical protein FQR65_LT04418 [Abscondita terminalis]